MEKRTISASKLRAYKSCLRLFYLQYHEELVPIEAGDAFTKGRTYHGKIDSLFKKGEYELTNDVTDAMMYAYRKYILPKLDIAETEKHFEVNLSKSLVLNGYFDAVDKNGGIIEYKTVGAPIDEKYVYSLNWDEQAPIYMLASKKTRLTYAVIQKPTIRQKQDESIDEYIDRCKAWYDEAPEIRTAVFPVIRSETEIKEKRNEIIRVAREMAQRKFWYCNPSQCKVLNCRYASICLEYNPEFLINFTKKEKRNADYQNTGY